MNDVSAMLADTAERLFATHAEGIESAARAGTWADAAWAAIEESGLPLALVPEEHGGFGIPASEALALIRLIGRHALALPLAETMIGNVVLASAGLPLAEGPVGLAEHAEARVPWGRFAKTIVVGSETGVQRHGASPVAAESTNVAGHPRDQISVLPGQTGSRAELSLLELGALARAMQMAGALERVLELTIEHVSSRVQFGRPLAKFQAIQQELAKLAGEVAAASAAADHAADTYATGGDLTFAVAVARTRIGEAASKATAIGHQLHGAIGFTREHALHRFTTALWAWRDEFGTQRYWTLALGKRALTAGRDGYWLMVVAA
ncbi:acyl-CoA dehydrogenase family protein [Sphingomonas sp. IC4-52]|uniref:acyl-CoA dehydrogenase family protein n=1 Tax=Sphingomonas sp. IC4-52 TaxID=2887202 RepID=UPI001D12004E|nr:acyl-CoA dehydrogenase family protein [Sphingomonas sp. IC4-52]MCC2979031.1 acyl-CoA/acyl-ACP dehydrogenase [Sphingomonas sp. IC4-52]